VGGGIEDYFTQAVNDFAIILDRLGGEICSGTGINGLDTVKIYRLH